MSDAIIDAGAPFGDPENGLAAVRPACAERWADFERLMGPRGGADGCWCMLWRQRAKEYAAAKGEKNKGAMRALMDAPQRSAAPGLLGYDAHDIPIGWISIAPRAEFVRLRTSRVLKPLDETEDLSAVWSVSCFFVAKSHRGCGVAVGLLQSAVDYAAAHGAQTVEGYPIDPKKPRYPAAYAWTGFLSVFRAAGFDEVARRSETRPIMRRVVKE